VVDDEEDTPDAKQIRVDQLLRAAGGWEAGYPGFTREECDAMAVRLREEARLVEKDLELAPIKEELERHVEVANINPVKLAISERQRAKSKARDWTRPWPAIVLIEKLRDQAPNYWSRRKLAKEIEERLGPEFPDLPELQANNFYCRLR
jgi:hypothetical protein